MIKRILVAVDGSEHATRAVDMAGAIAAKFDAAVTVVHAMPRAGSGRVPEELSQLVQLEHVAVTEAEIMRQVADEILRRSDAALRRAGVKQVSTLVEVGDPATRIADAARSTHAARRPISS